MVLIWNWEQTAGSGGGRRGTGSPKSCWGHHQDVWSHIAGLSKRELCPSCEHPAPPGEIPFPMGEKGPGGQGFLGTRLVALTGSWWLVEGWGGGPVSGELLHTHTLVFNPTKHPIPPRFAGAQEVGAVVRCSDPYHPFSAFQHWEILPLERAPSLGMVLQVEQGGKSCLCSSPPLRAGGLVPGCV